MFVAECQSIGCNWIDRFTYASKETCENVTQHLADHAATGHVVEVFIEENDS
jgi:hypothetical protein